MPLLLPSEQDQLQRLFSGAASDNASAETAARDTEPLFTPAN
jgi:hypothetical protein